MTISRIMGQHPNIRFTVDTGFPDKLIGRLRLGELDVVVAALPNNRIDPDLRFLRLTSDVIRVVGRKDHPLIRKRNRTLADYAAQRWVLPARQELVRQRLARSFAQAGFPEPTPSRRSRFTFSDPRGTQDDRLPRPYDHANPCGQGSARSGRR